MAKPAIEFILSLGNTKFNKALDASRAKVVSVGKQMAKGLDPAIDKFKQLRASAANVGAIGLAAGAASGIAALYKLNGILRESVQLAGVQEEAEVKLAAVIRATGGAAGYTADQLYKMAGDLQAVTTYGDETTISAMAVLATFKQIKGDTFKRATVAAMDMSTVMKQDLQSSIVQIGKALNDPIKGVSALSRVGVQFTESQKNMIKALQESGDLLGAQKIILEELEGQFGGAAAAARKYFDGALIATQNAFGDLKEEIGFLITKNQFFIEGLKLIEQQFISWTNTIKANGPELMEYAKQAALGFDALGESALQAMDFIYRGGQGIAGIFQRVSAFALDVSGGIFKIIQAGAALTDWLGITEGATDKWAMSAEAAFKAAEELKREASTNFDEMENGSAKIQAAEKALGKFRTAMEDIPSDKVAEVGENADKAANATDKLSDGTVEYEKKLVKVNGVWQQQLVAVEAVRPEIKKIMDDLDRLQNKTVTVTIKEKTVEARAHGGLIGALHMATGGAVRWQSALNGLAFPGYGGGDRRHVIAEDGEVMIKKESVRAAGLKAALAFNAGRFDIVMQELKKRFPQGLHLGGLVGLHALPALPMQTGGQVAAVGDTYNVNLNVSGSVSQATTQNARQLADMVVRELQRRHKGSSR